MRDVDSDAPVQALMRLARIHGPIYQLDFFGRPLVVVSSPALVDEVCDETLRRRRLCLNRSENRRSNA